MNTDSVSGAPHIGPMPYAI